MSTLLKTLTLGGLLAATGAQAASQTIQFSLYSDSNCQNEIVKETLTYEGGTGWQVFQQGVIFKGAMITGGTDACGVHMCQYGQSCYDTAIGNVDWLPYCIVTDPGYAYDKIMINTC